jgi:hypothetical protein
MSITSEMMVMALGNIHSIYLNKFGNYNIATVNVQLHSIAFMIFNVKENTMFCCTFLEPYENTLIALSDQNRAYIENLISSYDFERGNTNELAN